jgi:hypothetical protein
VSKIFKGENLFLCLSGGGWNFQQLFSVTAATRLGTFRVGGGGSADRLTSLREMHKSELHLKIFSLI